MKGKIFMCFLCLLFLSGCWDKKELNDVAVVMGVGLDKTGENQLRVTAQVIKPNAPDKGGGGGSELPTWALTANGKTMMDAIRQLNLISPRRLYWPHMQIIIIGEELAKDGISKFMTWIENDRDSRSGIYVVVTRGKAENLLNQKIELGNVPAKAMADFLDTAEMRQIDARKVTMRDLVKILSTPGIDPALDVIDPKEIRGKKETYQLSGIAVFKDDKLVGYIKGQKTASLDLVFQKYRYGILTMPMSDQKDAFFSYQVTDMRSKIKTDVQGEKITAKIDIFIEGNLSGQTGIANLIDPREREQAEKQIGRIIRASIEETFRQTAAMGADVYGIGQEVRRHHPQFWHKKKDEWTSQLKQVQMETKVDANIRRTGLILEPTHLKMK